MRWTTACCAIGALGIAISNTPRALAADGMPALVSAYADQLARQCGPLPPGASTAGMIERVDLDGDKIDDWVVDASRYPCPARPAAAAQGGNQLTVFRGRPNGVAVPVFQRVAFGARLLRPPQGLPILWVSLAGNDCGAAAPSDRCERRLVWDPQGSRFEATDPTAKAKRP